MIKFLRGSELDNYPKLAAAIRSNRSPCQLGLKSARQAQHCEISTRVKCVFYNPLHVFVTDEYGQYKSSMSLSPYLRTRSVDFQTTVENSSQSDPWECTQIHIDDEDAEEAAINLLAAASGLMSILQLAGLVFSTNKKISELFECCRIQLRSTSEVTDKSPISSSNLWTFNDQTYWQLLERSKVDPLEPILALENCNLKGLGLRSQQDVI